MFNERINVIDSVIPHLHRLILMVRFNFPLIHIWQCCAEEVCCLFVQYADSIEFGFGLDHRCAPHIHCHLLALQKSMVNTHNGKNNNK